MTEMDSLVPGQVLAKALGDGATDVKQAVGRWAATILGEEVEVTVYRHIGGDSDGGFQPFGSHRVDVLGGSTAYGMEGDKTRDTLQEALHAWGMGMKDAAACEGAALVKNED